MTAERRVRDDKNQSLFVPHKMTMAIDYLTDIRLKSPPTSKRGFMLSHTENREIPNSLGGNTHG